jgi:hypothetical protein
MVRSKRKTARVYSREKSIRENFYRSPLFLSGFPNRMCVLRDAFPRGCYCDDDGTLSEQECFSQERNQHARDLDPLRPGWLVGKHVCPAVPCSHTHARTHTHTHTKVHIEAQKHT